MKSYLKKAALAAATSTVVLMNVGEVTAGGTGTGFFINAKGDIVTNHHVTQGFYHYKDGKKEPGTCGRIFASYKHNIYPLRIIATDPHNDLAVLRISGSNTPKSHLVSHQPNIKPEQNRMGWTNINQILQPGGQIKPAQKQTVSTLGGVKFRYLPISFSSVWQGGKVHVFGFPYGSSLSSQMKVTSGSINSTMGDWNNSSAFQIDAAVHPGSSGSPVLDDKGNLVGVITSGYLKRSGINFAVKTDILRAFLRGNDIDFTYKYRKNPTTADILYHSMKNSVVTLTCHDFYES